MRTRRPVAGVVTQPGAAPGHQVYCPVSGVVFRVTAASPHRDVAGSRYYFCCDGCAAYFGANPHRVLALRAL